MLIYSTIVDVIPRRDVMSITIANLICRNLFFQEFAEKKLESKETSA